MLIAMAVYCTDANARVKYLEQTLDSLRDRVDFNRHRIIFIDNASSLTAKRVLKWFCEGHGTRRQVITLPTNLGTAAAINLGWRCAEPGETVCKMDDDVEIWHDNWPDFMEEVFARRPDIGICGLKRKDLQECPWASEDFYRSHLEMIEQHKPGERWLVVEHAMHIFGTCQAYSPKLREKIGYLYQPGLYGFDDALASLRARKAGFSTVFLPGIEIDHIDPGTGAYGQWKRDQAEAYMARYGEVRDGIKSGKFPVYYDGGF